MPDSEPREFPAWVISSVMDFLGTFVQGDGQEATDGMGYRSRSFLQEVERNLRQPLDWRQRERSAVASLLSACNRDPELLVDVVDFALRNILLGAYFQNREAVADGLDRALQESGAAWRVGRIEGTVNYRLERRVDPTAAAALQRLTSEETRGGGHLSAAWDAAYGRNPSPSKAYGEAVKAVEESAIPVVLPNDQSATLGKVIGELRATPTMWHCVLARESRTAAHTITAVDVLIAMLDLLWANQSDRHAPIRAITQPQAEAAVQLAVVLVGTFRSGAFSKR